MKLYFSGFSLKDEQELFHEYSIDNDFAVSGFSYGVIKAVEYVLSSKKRVDLLQLFSPAYFMDKDKKYKRMQLMFFKKDTTLYCENFLQNSGFKTLDKERYFSLGLYEELEELLYYNWDKEKLQRIIDNGTKIEIYLGANDKIIDSQKALEFFKEFGEVYYIKNKGHIL